MNLGHQVRLILNRKELLHRPESLYPQWADGYPEWIQDCSDITDEDVAFETPAIDKAIYSLSHKVDLVILNDVGPAFADYLFVPHVAMLTGSDLAYYASFNSIDLRTKMWDKEFKRSVQGRRYLRRMADMVARQRDGILNAEIVSYGHRGLIPSGDELLDNIGVSDSRRYMLYLSNVHHLDAVPLPDNEYLTILSGSRIVFRPENNPTLGAIDFKGTDVLLNGFALYCKRGGSGRLQLIRKGKDAELAAKMVADLQIEDRVHWLDEMSLSEFHQAMVEADLICDQFGSSFPGMVTADAFALGRPIMANLRNEIFSKHFPEPLPGFNAITPDQIADHLISLEENPALLQKTALLSRDYAENYLSPDEMARQLLNKVFSGGA